MPIAPEPGMTAADIKAANAAVNAARIKNATPKPTTYNQRVVSAIKSGTQSTVDVNANPIVPTGGGTPPGPTGDKNPPPPGKTDVPVKTITGTADNGDGTYTVTYSDGSTEVKGTKFTANPGATGLAVGATRTLAKDTFANTLAILMGAAEASQPWVQEMYGLASGFYNSGSSIDEALNLSLFDAKAKGLAPAFTKRFKGVFDLQDKLNKGEAVIVPTIADFVKSEAEMASLLKEAGLGDLAKQEFLGDVIGQGNSVLDVGNLISKVFNTIDNAPKALRDTLDTYFPSVDRTSLAKALLTGKEGAAALEKKVKNISVLSAAGSQNVSIDLATASDIAARGVDYNTALTGMGQVKELERTNTLAQFSGGTFTQKEALGLTFAQDQAAKAKAEAEKAKEFARYGGTSGLSASALRGKNTRQQV